MATTMDPEDYTVVPIPLLNATVSNIEMMSRVTVIFNAPLSFEKLHTAWITALQARPIMQAPMKKSDLAPSGLAYYVRTPIGISKYLKKQNEVPDHLRDFYCLDESYRSIESYCPGLGSKAKTSGRGHGGILISQGPESSEQKRCTAFNAADGIDQLFDLERPQTTIQVTRFNDATMITLSVNHAFGDLVTIKSYMKAWETALSGNAVQPYEQVDADPFAGYEPGGDFAAESAPGKSPPPPPGWKVYGLFDKARLMRRYLWDYYVARPESSIEDRRIFIPHEVVQALEETARYDLTFLQKRLDEQSGVTTGGNEEAKKLFVSRSDVLYAWLLKHSHAHLAPEQPSTAVTVANGRFRPPAGADIDPKALAGNDLLCGAMAIALPSLTAGKIMTLPLGELALHIRNGIKTNTSPENVRKWLTFQFYHILWKNPSKQMAVPFQPDHFITGMTDWRQVHLEQVDFTPARLDGDVAAAVSVSAIDGHMVVNSSRRDMYICLGDIDGGVCILGYASKDQWQDPRSFGKYKSLLRVPKSKL
ncbi:hypothetical protein V2A60_005286 [Cordyceps javanica]|uniref:LysR family regulatory protein n=1 Tax=Cordyceps javanica TaxID=43265 RepID=A0A545VDP7_9HYPO|nr:LysR family regulatory protein [Cordyceps javanica]TQW10471.1 LysR family regulatory protein [Cordyceps javanica]